MHHYSDNICAIIPFYNEKRTLQKVIEETLSYCNIVIAVDDGSTDGSASEIKPDPAVIVISMRENKGKGAALKEGFLKSIELKTHYTITIDADLQHPPSLIPEFLSKSGTFDIIIGNRLGNNANMPLQRVLSNTITSFLLSVKTGSKIIDSQSGYRLYRTEILPEILTKFSGYEAESEIIVNAARKKYSIGFIDIPSVYTDQESKMRPLNAILGFLRVMMI